MLLNVAYGKNQIDIPPHPHLNPNFSVFLCAPYIGRTTWHIQAISTFLLTTISGSFFSSYRAYLQK